VLSALTPAEPAAGPPLPADIYPAVGRLTVTTHAGVVTRVEFYLGGQNPLYFAVNGVRCFRGGPYMPGLRPDTYEMGVDESVLLSCILDAIHYQQTTGQKSTGMGYYLRLFKRATGRDPPVGKQ
jgi:hypothetical protein